MSMVSTYLEPTTLYVSIKGGFINMNWQPDQPHNALPLLPPPLEAVETRAILKACIPARAALGCHSGQVSMALN